ncbi:hypothetical protein [Patulibacter minatonensis]|uniref:hypothetical protein n=1 Tax=Patulibacter minatonensis TaxID=298163 RepID=UPI0012FCE969|nr:hypothetical protein [Patulibacter minatonensis]
METYTFDVTEYEPGKPWIARGTTTTSVEAASPSAFWKQIHAMYPEERFKVTPTVGQGL